MGFLHKLFGKNEKKDQIYYEIDNIGTRHDVLKKANDYWLLRTLKQKHEPYILYIFENEENAKNALLDLDFIHVAQDTQKLICRKPLSFGYYSDEKGNYEAVLIGEDLSIEDFEQAQKSFIKFRGKLKNEQKPEYKESQHVQPKSIDTGKVTFVEKYSKDNSFMGVNTYEIYKGPDAATAKAFLETKKVTKSLYYIIVETPEGNYGRDIEGMYKE